MTEIIITMGSIGIILLLISFFLNDRFKTIENQIEQMSMAQMQESYQVNKKIKILEEELLPDTLSFDLPSNGNSNLRKQIEALIKSGKSNTEISKITKLSEYDINMIRKQLSI